MNFSSKDECIKDFKENYKKPSHPIAFSGINNIFKYYKGILKKNDIEKLLSSVDSYTLRKQYKQLKRNPSYTHFKRYQFQVDLIDIQQLSRYNDGVKYILACIDTFTRKAWVKPCHDKSAKTVINAFQDIIRSAGKTPITLVADQGRELDNQIFVKFCENKKINFFHNFTSGHAAYVERFNRTFQDILYKFLDEYETRRYIDNLQDFVFSYNNREHRMIGLTPEEAEREENHEKVSYAMSIYHDKIKREKPKYSINQLVRISLHKGVFHRGYKEQSSYEVFRIYKIKQTLPKPLYLLESFDRKEKLKGGFYAHEITPVNSDIFKVEKVLKQRKVKRKLQYFVKWKGYDSSHNSWIDASDIVREYRK